MPSKLPPTHYFFLKVILWLPLLFAVWFYFSGLLVWPVAVLSNWIVKLLSPDLIQAIEQHGYLLDVVTNLTPPTHLGLTAEDARQAELVFEINPLIYGYSIPLYTGLILSSPGTEKEKWMHWLIGLSILLLVQVWGVLFNVAKTLLFDLGAEVNSQISVDIIQQNLVALGYQLGVLILPAITPIIIWMAFNRKYILELSRYGK